jgi:Cu-Zn family superoxide dismutase
MGNNNSVENAVCVIQSNIIQGIIRFRQYYNYTLIFGRIIGLKPNQEHAIHIHECGDLTKGCESACAHYNPYGMNHGGPKSCDRHVGDLGNIKADSNGVAEFRIADKLVQLNGPHNVIGRSVVIHEDIDDFGLGGYNDSLTTGHAGKRIGCGIIGIASISK